MPTAPAREHPFALDIILEKAVEPARDLGQRHVAGAFAIGKVDRLEPAESQQRRMDQRCLVVAIRVFEPVAQAGAGFADDRQAGQGIALELGGWIWAAHRFRSMPPRWSAGKRAGQRLHPIAIGAAGP